MPFVEARWPLGSRRVLYGESYGGLLVLAAALVAHTKVGRQP